MTHPRRLRRPLPSHRRTNRFIVASALAIAAACDTGDGRALAPARPDQTASVLTTTTSPDTTAALIEVEPDAIEAAPADGFSLRLPWGDDAEIPAENTCDGNVPPTFSWDNLPAGTLELAVVMTDASTGFANWVVSGITPPIGEVVNGNLPPGAVVSQNGTAAAVYSGPCPAVTSSYLFQLFAVGQQLELSDATLPNEAAAAIEAAAVGVVAVSGVVTR